MDATIIEKIVNARTAISKIKNGSHIFIGTGCGEPQHLIEALVNSSQIKNNVIYQMFSGTLAKHINNASFLKRFTLRPFLISSELRKAASIGKMDYIPISLARIPEMFYSRRIGLDVALIQVSPPDNFGYCSLGVSVDITRAGLESAGLVIAQINTNMPKTMGDSFVHVDQIDHFVLFDELLVEAFRYNKEMNNEVTRRIGMYVSQNINDGATLQIGFGHLPNAILPYLYQKKDLGIHTQVITDGMLPLFESGVITNRKKSIFQGRVVASLCMGSKNLYDYIDNNPFFYFRTSDYVNDPIVIAKNNCLVSISSALEVDLTGQVCADSLGNKFYSGIGDRVDFFKGASMSKGGLSIIVLPSTIHTQNGKASRIVPNLSNGAGISNTRTEVDFVITEYGIAELQGRSICQRIVELSKIAHPAFRAQLIEEARKIGYITLK